MDEVLKTEKTKIRYKGLFPNENRRGPFSGDSNVFGNIPSGSGDKPRDDDSPDENKKGPFTGDSNVLGNIPSGSGERKPEQNEPESEPSGNIPPGSGERKPEQN